MTARSQALHMLAFDHRGSFERLHAAAVPDWSTLHRDDAEERMRASKRVIYDGFLAALDAGAPADRAAILVDEQRAAAIATDAAERGITVAIAVERSGKDVFDFEHGDDFGAHLTRYAPDYAKVLVRHNPDGDADDNRLQAERLLTLSEWCVDRPIDLLLELLVPPTDGQLDKVDGDRDAYDRQLRPELARRAIADLQDAGVRPALWKIEGVDDRADARLLADQARAVDATVGCVVLGRGADRDRVAHWLRQSAGVDGFVGFAIGRSIFTDELHGWLGGEHDRDTAVAGVARHYRHFVDVYTEA